MSFGEVINRATTLNPFIMGIVVSVSVGCILTLPISSAALCISIGIGGLAAGAGMGTAGLIGPLGCWDTMASTTDHGILLAEIIGLYFIAPAILSLLFHLIMKRLGWVKDGDMKLQQ